MGRSTTSRRSTRSSIACSRRASGRSSSSRTCRTTWRATRSATVFDYRGIISPPRDEERWAALVRDLVDPPDRALRTRDRAQRGRSRSGTSRTCASSGPPPSPTTSGCTRSAPGPSSRSIRSSESVARRRRRRAGSTTCSSTPAATTCRSTSSRPTPTAWRRSTCARSPPASGAPTCRCGGPSGASARVTASRSTTAPGPRRSSRAGMRSAAGRLEALAYWVASDHFVELGRGADPVPRRVRAADDRQPPQAPVLGDRAAGAARRRRAGDRDRRRRRGLAGRSLGVARCRRPGGDRGLERHAGPVEGGRRPNARSGGHADASRGSRPGPYELRHDRVDARALEHHPHLGATRPPRLAGRGRLGAPPGGRPPRAPSSRPARCGPTAGRAGADLRPADAGDVARRARARRSSAGACRPSLSVGQPLAAELRNETGLAIELLENGSVFADPSRRHPRQPGPRQPARGRHRQPLPPAADARRVSRPCRCSGRLGRAAFATADDGASWEGSFDGLDYTCTLRLAPRPGRVVLDGPAGQHDGQAPQRRRPARRRTSGSPHEAAVRSSELYTSQYIDHTILDDDGPGLPDLLAPEPATGRGVPVGRARLPRGRGWVT